MKLHRLELLRYGHLSDVTLDFPDDARLHVVHGANEAGKSTALAAIADALFGFGHRTDFDFLHGGPQLRVGFTVSARDGATGSFVRRKGRRDTLRDAADQVVPDDALRRFLGGISRELFERGFGLDGARLREGGQELLRVGGEAGESLLAGAGLLNLRAVLIQFEEEAKLLVGDGRGRRRLSDAVEAWRKAQREGEERAVTPRAWQEADAAHGNAVAALSGVQDQIRALAEEDSRLQRVRRVAPLLAKLADAREEFTQLADAPHLPPDAEVRFHDRVAARRDAIRDVERETAEAQRLTLNHAALPQDTLVLAAQDAIDALAAQRPVLLQAMGDRSKVQVDAAALRAKVTEAIEELGLSLAPEAARDALPAAAARRKVLQLVNQHAALATEATSAARELAAGQRRRSQATQALAAAPEPTSPALLRRTIESVRSEGPLNTEFDRARRALAAAEETAATALAALPLWRGDIASLIACPLPLPAEADDVTTRLNAGEKDLALAQASVTGLEAEIAEIEEQLSRLARGETVPTPDAVAAARAARDRVWRILRRLQEGGPPPTPEETTGFQTVPLPDSFEALRDEADRLADRRADDAQRVADFLTATARLDLLRGQRETVKATLAAAKDTAEQTEAVWQAMWASAGLVPLSPPVMAEWRRAHADVLRLAEAVTAAQRQRDDLAARHDRAYAILAKLLPDASPQETLAALLLRAEATCAAAEADAMEHRASKKALADAEERLPELQLAVATAAAALEAWQYSWSPAVIALGLQADATIDTAEAAYAAWARIAETVPAWRTEERRIADMTATIETFASELLAVRVQLNEPASDESAPVITARLARRLAEARKAASDASDLTNRIVAHETATADAQRRLAAAEADLDALRQTAEVTDDSALQKAIERARQRDMVAETIVGLEQSLLSHGDGMPATSLRAEMIQIDPDAVVGRLAEIGTELATLGDRREELSSQRTRAESVLEEMREGRDAATTAQQAEDALAEARAAAERYARLHVARVLLRSGIDRFRKEQQGPLLRRAGAHFALLTGGRYERLIVDYDAAGRTILLAIRDTGAECPVEALSEGARDQLYLALRTAAIEAHAAQAEPLPFIADDLLVHFDDVRAATAITLLAELGQTTQVILFTHHDHIAALAAREAGVVVQNMPSLTVSRSAALAVA